MNPAIEALLHRFRARMRAFARSTRGNVAMMFAVALVPLIIATTTGLDYARAMLVRSQMSDALDAAALAVGSSGGTLDAVKAMAQAYFNANYKGDMGAGGTGPTVNVSNYDSKGSVTITADISMDTTVMKLVGQPTIAVASSTTVVWGQSKLWVSLVLDNSGSMSQGDKNGSKMDALQSASKSLLGKLQAVSITPGDVQVGIVPFTRVVNYKTAINGNSNSSGSWIYWGFWEAAPANVTVSSLDTANLTANDTCPFTDKSQGFHCQKNSTNGASSTTTVPSGGLICPSIDSGSKNSDRSSEYYNGCYTSTSNGTKQVSSGKNASCGSATHCSCSGGKNSVCTQTLYKHAWAPNSHSTWTGCFTDRAQGTSAPSGKVPDYDTQNTVPGSDTTGFPATNPSACLSTVTMPLNYGWTALSSKITAMTPSGSTNQAIGVAHGWQMLTPGNPYGTPTVPANTARYMILFSDGLNTQDRWWGDGSTEGTSDDDNIDDRMSAACTAAKADGIVIYTLFVHIGTSGNSQPLEDCATDSSKYYDLTSTDQIQGAFDEIAQQITNVRVSH
ncbi:MAG TPA: pilus assembly protein TadG-related protein [Rhizomicrobium sp.]